MTQRQPHVIDADDGGRRFGRGGAAYLPIDPALPIERAALMPDECATRRVVVDAQGATLAWPAAVRSVRLDPDADADVDAHPFADTRTHAETEADRHGADGAIVQAGSSAPDAFPDPDADALAARLRDDRIDTTRVHAALGNPHDPRAAADRQWQGRPLGAA